MRASVLPDAAHPNRSWIIAGSRRHSPRNTPGVPPIPGSGSDVARYPTIASRMHSAAGMSARATAPQFSPLTYQVGVAVKARRLHPSIAKNSSSQRATNFLCSRASQMMRNSLSECRLWTTSEPRVAGSSPAECVSPKLCSALPTHSLD